MGHKVRNEPCDLLNSLNLLNLKVFQQTARRADDKLAEAREPAVTRRLRWPKR